MIRFIFGNFKRSIDSRLITYAVSSNDSSINELIDIGSSRFENLYNISLREKKYALLLSRTINREVTVDIDPVLLAGANIWFHLFNHEWKGDVIWLNVCTVIGFFIRMI